MAACKLLLYVLYLFLLEVATSKICTKINDCECRKSNGKIMSLKAVDSGTSKPKFSGIKVTDKQGGPRSYTLSWNPCTKFSDESCRDVLLCQKQGSRYGTTTYSVAEEASEFIENDDGSITLKYKKVRSFYSRQATIKLVCDRSQNPGKLDTFQDVRSYYTRRYTYGSIFVTKKSTVLLDLQKTTFRSKCVCDEGCLDTPVGGGTTIGPSSKSLSDDEGLSIGSILLIVLLLLLLVYIVAGLLFNKYRNGVNSFPEMFPNHSFWGDFPFLVKDGFVFTFQGISAGCKRLYLRIKGDPYPEI